MDRLWYRRIDERERGQRRLRQLTGWAIAGALTASTAFGVAFAHKDAAARTQTSGGGQPATSNQNGGNAGQDDSTNGGQLQPPAQPPAQPTQPRQHGGIFSGGS